MRRAPVTLVLSVLVFSQLLAFPLAAGADQWVPGPTPSTNYSFIVSPEFGHPNFSEVNTFLGPDVNGVPTQTAIQYCSSVTGPSPCNLTSSGTAGLAIVFLPECTSDTEDDCVASMSLGPDSSDVVASTPNGMTDGPTTAGDPSMGIPAGSTIGLWSNPLTNAGGTDTYATLVELQILIANGAITSMTLHSVIDPYKEVSNPQDRTPVVIGPLGTVTWGPGDCAWQQTGECGQNEDFTPGTVASMTVRVPSSIGGWFSGRLASPTIADSSFDSSTSLLTVRAGVVTFPTYEVSLAPAATSNEVLDYINTLRLPTTGFALWSYPDNPETFGMVDALRDTANNTASGQLTTWSFNSVAPGQNGQPVSPCFTKDSQVDGFVSTNAMVYQGTAPTFSGHTFDYQVAGMHYNIGGVVAEGSYDLNIRDSVAECLYGFAKAPISATVTITEDSVGDQSVTTTSVSDANGWIHVGAYGFNFSDPTISVNLTQKALKPKKITIVCVKGRSVRRVTGTSPRCPAGYKKRR